MALYGGTFDPVHVGHTALARRLLELFALDEVLFIPAHVAPHKRGREVSPALHRYAMLALATQGEERFRVSTVELDEPESPYTVGTLARFVETTGREPVTDYEVINRELAAYDPQLAERPQFVVATKLDALDEPERLERLREKALADGREFFEISSVTNRGVRELVRAVERKLEEIGKSPVIQTRETLLGEFER